MQSIEDIGLDMDIVCAVLNRLTDEVEIIKNKPPGDYQNNILDKLMDK